MRVRFIVTAIPEGTDAATTAEVIADETEVQLIVKDMLIDGDITLAKWAAAHLEIALETLVEL